jgi:integrase
MSILIELNFDKLVERYGLPRRMKDELKIVLEGNLSKIFSRTRMSQKNAGLKTQKRRLYTVFKTLKEVRAAGYKVESPYNLSGKHLEVIVRRWADAGQTAGTMETKLAHLGAFCEWMGKDGMVKSLYDYVPKEELVKTGRVRRYVAVEDKSWEAHGVNMMEKIAEIERDEPVVAIQLKLQAAFALRVEESFALPIAKTMRNIIRRGDGKMVVSECTKGGRDRLVPLQLQAHVLQEALPYANSRSGSTTPGEYSLERWKNHYYYVLRKHGITKDDLGITSHGLRHQWVQEFYKVLTGYEAPIKGGNARPSKDVHIAAMKAAIEAVGHSRVSKTGAYMSTFPTMDRLKTPVVGIDEVLAALDKTHGDKKAAAALLGITRAKLYRIRDANRDVFDEWERTALG